MFDAGYQKGELMITRDDIVIRKAILHILDTDRGDCILSSALLNPGPEMHDFIRNHIYKIVSSDDTKNCVFDSEFSPIYAILESWDESNDASFIETSQTIANKLYVAMGEGLDIPAADLLFVTFQIEGTIYLALLKMNYKRNYNHDSICKGDYTYVGLLRGRSLISATSRVPEAAIINLSDYSIKLLEKRYEVNGGYEFFKNEKTRVKVNDEGETCWYWTRSARLGSAHYVHLVHPSGYCVIATAHGGGRCLPACTIAA